jgi:hypothetical protein
MTGRIGIPTQNCGRGLRVPAQPGRRKHSMGRPRWVRCRSGKVSRHAASLVGVSAVE